jgi:hypothetical protein
MRKPRLERWRARRCHRLFLALPILVLVTAACRPTPEGSPSAEETADPTAGFSVAATPQLQPTAQPASALRVWAVPEFAAEGTSDEQSAFRAHLDAIAQVSPELAGSLLLAPAWGEGGIESLLRSTSSVAPEAMPDIVMLPLASLDQVMASGLVQPLPADLAQERVAETFDFARASVTDAAGTQFGVPFAVNTLHAIARDEPPPAHWSELKGSGARLVVPSGEGTDTLAFAVSAYLAGPAGIDTIAAPNADDVAAAFEPIEQLVAAGSIEPIGEGSSERAVWNAFLLEEAPAALVSAGVFAHQQANFPALTWGRVPASADAPPIGWGWAFVLTSSDPDRLARSADLVRELTAPDRRDWIIEGEYLPAWDQGWSDIFENVVEAPPSEEYLDFAATLLDDAVGLADAHAHRSDWIDGLNNLLSGEGADAAAAQVAPQD